MSLPLRDALFDLCYECGYRWLTLEMLLERAGVDEATFHRRYADLEDCFCGVYQDEVDAFYAQLSAALAGKPNWRERIRAAAYMQYDYLRANPKRTHFVTIEIRVAGERAQLLLAAALERQFDLIDEGREELEDPEALSRATSMAIGGSLLNQVYSFVAAGDVPPEMAEQAVREALYTAILPYLGKAAAEEELHLPPPNVD